MAQQVAIFVAHSLEIAALALVDDDDYARVAMYQWRMQGTPDAPRYVYRLLDATERHASGRKDRSLAQEILHQPGRITFRNGNRLDCRKANLLSGPARQRQQERAAQALRTAPLAAPSRDAPAAEIPLTQGWTAWVDPDWAERLGRSRWVLRRQGPNLYATRVVRRANGSATTIYLARVLAGLQDLEEGVRLRPGVVTLDTPPDVANHCLDLRTTNLIVTTRGGVNLRRPTRTRSRGVYRQGQRYRAHLKIGGQERVLGLYDTPEAAAQAREAELHRLGLHDLVRLQAARGHQAARQGGDAWQTPGEKAAAATDHPPLTV